MRAECHNPPCVRPDHLFLGTDTDNVQDAIKKGRFHFNPLRKGETNNGAKLTWTAVEKIRSLYSTGQYSQRHIAAMFSVHVMTVSDALLNKTWQREETI